MKYAAFQAAAERAYAEIPDHFKVGIEGLTVSRETVASRDHEDVFTMGECLTETWPSSWDGPETTRSTVVLYWGSFRQMAKDDPDFDWEGEIWETLTHELRHHLESLASEDQLEDVDYAADEDFKRTDGLDFDPWYYQKADPAGAGVFRLERHTFLEQKWTPARFEAAAEIPFEWEGKRWSVPRPDELGDVHYVLVLGVTREPESLELVLVRERSLWQSVTGLFGGGAPEVLESEADATARE
jgi:hypothetical protein